MNLSNIIDLLAGTMQVAVAIYALRLNRLFGARRVGWTLFMAFALVAMTHIVNATQPSAVLVNLDTILTVAYLLISVLLLIGMAHIEAVMLARQRAEEELARARVELQRELKERTDDLVRTHEKLRQVAKMEAIGQLAAGVAHDFNNMLTVIQCHTKLLLSDPSGNGESSKQLTEIFSASERAAKLTRQLLAFSRRSMLQKQTVDLNEVIAGLESMLRRLIGEDIVLRTVYAPDLPRVVADRGMMEQIIMNLVINARDAMTKGGTLTLTTEKAEVSHTQILRRNESLPGQFACVRVRDTGVGMSPEVLAHLFEPFFTTKEVGKGTGLGLAMVYGIVKQHDGWVEVASEPGQGAEFKIFLPHDAKVVSAPQPMGAGSGRLTGRETILLVEDEAVVRELTCLVLTQQGYQVVEADSGPRALDIWQRQSNRIDLLLTDIILPGGMTGRDLAAHMKTTRPQLSVLYVSGYSPSRSGQDLKILEELTFLPKPYVPDQLLRRVRECLDAPKEDGLRQR
jgi:two-component system cell cycle sensor histidine kinase/response regulator CckA